MRFIPSSADAWRALASLAALLLAACTNIEMPDASNGAVIENPDIDLSKYELTFDEDFNRLSVSAWRCDTTWIAHTPWRGDFGHARFADPSRRFPFVARQSMLRIEARKEPDGAWLSGLLSSRNTCWEGFAQQYGYFEARAMLPEGAGFWPAFWLIGVDRDSYTAEIDVIEHHGHAPERFTSTIHIHPRVEGVERYIAYHVEEVTPGVLSNRFNLYGVEIGEEETVFYFNRKEIWRTPTVPELRQPFFPLINLAMDAGFITEDTPDQAFMYVDYVRVWRRKPGAND